MDRSLAPGFARWTYTGAGGVHHGILPVNLEPGWVAGSEPNVLSKDGSSVGFVDAMTGFIDAWKNLASTNQNIGLAEVYAVDPDTGEGTFVFGFDLGTVGLNATPSAAKLGTQVTFKLTTGGTYRALWMENGTLQDVDVRPPFVPTSPHGLFAGYAISDASIIYGRGNAYPFAPMRLLTKEYDALRKRTGL